eukprot:Hpha_TRINITY_DN26810_c0_g1::TRINITY_DN26810_c0_g1_i1::g.17359::m.17359
MLLVVWGLCCTQVDVKAWVSRVKQDTRTYGCDDGGGADKPDYLLDLYLWNSVDTTEARVTCLMNNDIDFYEATRTDPETTASMTYGDELTVYLRFKGLENDGNIDCAHGPRDNCKEDKTCDWIVKMPYPLTPVEVECGQGGHQVWVTYFVLTSSPTLSPSSPPSTS